MLMVLLLLSSTSVRVCFCTIITTTTAAAVVVVVSYSMYVCAAAVLCEISIRNRQTEQVTNDELQQSVIHQEAETESKQ